MAADVILILGEKLDNIATNHYITLVSFTILVYEYVLTLYLEVERFWGSPFSFNWAAALFFLNRYMVLLGHIPVIIEFFWATGDPNKMKYIAIAIQIIVAAMLIMRMYALYERSRRVLALYLTVSLSVVGVACWAVLGGKMNTKPPDILVDIGCGVTLTHSQAIRLAAAWSGMLVFDSLVFGMTLYKSLTLPRTVDLLSLLLRDGAIYFGVMIAANIANILTFVLGGPFTRGVATTFTNIISSIMISRLMLNLRSPSLTVNTKGSRGHCTPADTTYPGIEFAGPGETTYAPYAGGETGAVTSDAEAGYYEERRGRSKGRRRESVGSSRSFGSRRGGSRQNVIEVELDGWQRPHEDTDKEEDGDGIWKNSSVFADGDITVEHRGRDRRQRGLLEGYDYVSRGPGRPETSASGSAAER